MYIYIYKCPCVYVCVCVRARVRVHVYWRTTERPKCVYVCVCVYDLKRTPAAAAAAATDRMRSEIGHTNATYHPLRAGMPTPRVRHIQIYISILFMYVTQYTFNARTCVPGKRHGFFFKGEGSETAGKTN